MNYRSIKKLADQLGLEVDNDLTFIEGQWHIEICAPEGQSFGGCQYHAAVCWLTEDESDDKRVLWYLVACRMKEEATELGDCHCGHWSEEE